MSQFDKSINRILASIVFEDTQNPQQSTETPNLADEALNYLKGLEKQIKSNPKDTISKLDNEVRTNYEIPADSLANDFIQKLVQTTSNFKEIPSNLQTTSDSSSQPDENTGEENEENVDTNSTSMMDAIKSGWERIKPAVQSGLEKLQAGAGAAMNHGLDNVVDFVVDNSSQILSMFISEKARTEISELSQGKGYRIISIFDPTGIMSWPYLAEAKKQYDSHKGTPEENVYALNLLACLLAITPAGRVGTSILGLPLRILRKTGILGPARSAKVANGFARELELLLKAEGRVVKGERGLKSLVSGEKALSKTSKAEKIIGGVTKPIRATGKALSTANKVITPLSKVSRVAAATGAGNLPGKFKEWTKKGEDIRNNIKPAERRLGLNNWNFNNISTQR